MKNILSLLSILFGVFVFVSCADDAPTAIIKDSVDANTLDATTSSSYVLTKNDEALTFDEFNWTAPDYGLSVSITYTLQLDVASNSFADAVTLVTTEGLSSSITIKDINKKLLDLGLTPDEETLVEMRIKSTVNSNIEPVYTNVRQFTVTPYATSFPPIYIVGDDQSWDFPKAVKVKNTVPGVYVTIANFTSNATFRFFEELDWGSKVWNFTFFDGGTVDANLISAGDNDNNFRFNGTTGTYKITVSTKDKTIVMEAADTPSLYMLGDAIQGWDFAKSVELTWMGGGHFQASSPFYSGIFRFFGKYNDWGSGYGYTYFANFVDPLFNNKDDGDKNFDYVGTAGTSYTIDVDLDFLTVNMKP